MFLCPPCVRGIKSFCHCDARRLSIVRPLLPAWYPNTQAFSESHALDLLKGRNEDIARIVLEKFDKKLVHMKYKPFMLFRCVL